MPPAEMPGLLGFAHDSVVKTSPHFHRQECLPQFKGNFLDEGLDKHSLNWDSLWIDMGGEG